jgi:NADPH:quinone reductase-like Zn-dependent oxidoreductase
MRAVVYGEYGAPDVLRVEEVPVPTPGPGQVLIRVVATSLNLTDWEGLCGSPAYARIGGLRSPARPILGSDIAGVVEAAGDGVDRFRTGDEVYGDNLDLKGGFAEYAIAPETALARKPDGLTFAEASTIPQAGAIALQGTAAAGPGVRFLVNGGGGGTGMFAIQLAKRAGAHVTAVDNEGKLDFMRSLGADEVIDYRVDDFTSGGATYDVILDPVGHRSVLGLRRALERGGRYCFVGGTLPRLLRVMTVGAIAARLTGRRMGLLAVKEGPDHFGPLADLCLAGEIAVRIDRTYTLDEVPDAIAEVGAGRIRGKAVVEIA